MIMIGAGWGRCILVLGRMLSVILKMVDCGVCGIVVLFGAMAIRGAVDWLWIG